MKSVIALLLLLSLSAPALAQPMRACTMMACENGLMLGISPELRWRPGAYRFSFRGEGVDATCEGRLPLPACGTPALRCSDAKIMIMESGCALPPDSHGFGSIRLEHFPSELTVEITRQGAPLVAQTLRPQYRTVRPNGPDCEPVCRQASLPLEQGQ
jgi:hypothetical protein